MRPLYRCPCGALTIDASKRCAACNAVARHVLALEIAEMARGAIGKIGCECTSTEVCFECRLATKISNLDKMKP